MTVSRIINNSGYVKEETRNKVLKVIKELDFRPNMTAKSLSTKKSHLIAYVMVNISDPYHNKICQSIENVCSEYGYAVIICDAYSKSREEKYINFFRDMYFDGAIFDHLAITEEQIQNMEADGLKCVMIDNEEDIPNVCSINTDNYYGGFIAAEHLIKKGHTSIAYICGTLKPRKGKDIPYEDTFQFNIWKQRTDGFVAALDKYNIQNRFFFQGNGLNNVADQYIKRIMDKLVVMDNKPTAIYCENDVMAIALLNQMKERDIKVPDDFAIIGHDGVELCRMLHPYITTISQNGTEIGKVSAERLIMRVKGDEEIVKTVFKPKLELGETT